MRPADYLLGAIVAGVVGFVGYQAAQVRRESPRARTAVSAESLTDSDGHRSTAEAANTTLSGAAARDAIELNRSSTYIDDLLAERDSTLRRWPLQTARPIRVWIEDPEKTPGGIVGGTRFVRQAFDEWTMVGIPVRFEMVGDSASADVIVVWRERLDEKRVGITQMRGVNDFFTRGVILLATHRPNGDLLIPAHVSSTVLHEVGHLLGLGHTPDSASVMYPELSEEIRARRVAEVDRVTLQLLYRLPVGKLR